MRFVQGQTKILALVSALSVASALLAADWPTYLSNNSRQAINSAEMQLSPSTVRNLATRWVYTTGGTVAASATVVNGVVYVGSWDGYEYAINATTGQKIWSTYLGTTSNPACFNVNAGITSAATVQNNTVYVGGGGSSWYALDAATGNVLWSVPTGDNSAAGGHYNWSSPLIYNGYAYIGIASFCDVPLVQGQLLQVKISTGQIINFFNVVPSGQTGGGIWTSPSIDPASNTVFVTTGTKNGSQPYSQAVLALDASSLALKSYWSIPPSLDTGDSDWGTSPLLYTSNGRTLVSGINKDGLLFAFDSSNLNAGPIWQQQVAVGGVVPQNGDGSVSSGAFDGSRLYYAGGNTTINGVTYKGSLRAFDPSTGSPLWQVGTAQTPLTAVAYANGVVYDSAGNTLLAVKASTGKLLSSTMLSDIAYGAPSVSNGTVYVGTIDGNVYAFTNKTGSLLGTSWNEEPGSAVAVSAGADGSLWTLGTTGTDGGNTINYWNGNGWTTVDGGGVQIAVDTDGSPWVVNSVGSIWHRVGGVNGQWVQQPGTATTIGIGANHGNTNSGHIWTLGTATADGGYTINYWNGNGWTTVDGGATRISVAPDGTPWVVNSVGNIYHRNAGAWTQLPGSAHDIGVGADNSVWVIGTTATTGGYVVSRWNGSSWTSINGGGVSVAVSPNGLPYIVDSSNNLWQRK